MRCVSCNKGVHGLAGEIGMPSALKQCGKCYEHSVHKEPGKISQR